MQINDFVRACHENAAAKGFWDKPRETGTLIALIHSEVTEAMDASSCAEFCEELADICIRIGDLCGGLGIDFERILGLVAEQFEEKENFYINTSNIAAIEKSLSVLKQDFDDYKNACNVHGSLSYALEHDRKNNREKFELCIGLAFIDTLAWAAQKGFRVKDSIIAKMEKNKTRPRLHGKEY